MWLYIVSRHASNEPTVRDTSNSDTFSDLPPSYNTVAGVDLPDLVISVPHDLENPPTFDSCVTNNRYLPGMENQAFDGVTDEDDLPPPPSYPGSLKRKKSSKVVYVNRSESPVPLTIDEEMQSLAKDSV